jgi:hypothetical protein
MQRLRCNVHDNCSTAVAHDSLGGDDDMDDDDTMTANAMSLHISTRITAATALPGTAPTPPIPCAVITQAPPKSAQSTLAPPACTAPSPASNASTHVAPSHHPAGNTKEHRVVPRSKRAGRRCSARAHHNRTDFQFQPPPYSSARAQPSAGGGCRGDGREREREGDRAAIEAAAASVQVVWVGLRLGAACAYDPRVFQSGVCCGDEGRGGRRCGCCEGARCGC